MIDFAILIITLRLILLIVGLTTIAAILHKVHATPVRGFAEALPLAELRNSSNAWPARPARGGARVDRSRFVPDAGRRRRRRRSPSWN